MWSYLFDSAGKVSLHSLKQPKNMRLLDNNVIMTERMAIQKTQDTKGMCPFIIFSKVRIQFNYMIKAVFYFTVAKTVVA